MFPTALLEDTNIIFPLLNRKAGIVERMAEIKEKKLMSKWVFQESRPIVASEMRPWGSRTAALSTRPSKRFRFSKIEEIVAERCDSFALKLLKFSKAINIKRTTNMSHWWIERDPGWASASLVSSEGELPREIPATIVLFSSNRLLTVASPIPLGKLSRCSASAVDYWFLT